MYGAQLIEALRRVWAPDGAGQPKAAVPTRAVPTRDGTDRLEFFGVGGDRMRAAGCNTVVDAKDLSVVGITEILSHLPNIWGLFHRLIREADQRKPDLAIVIDSPAFNWRVARQMHKRGIPVVYYVCPQFWAWRQGRVRLLRKYVDKALVIFPFEEEFYRDRGVDATFVGHPLADLPRPATERADYALQNKLDSAKSWITLMPGSRAKEVRMNLPVILESAAKLGADYEYLLPVAPTLDAWFLKQQIDCPVRNSPGSGGAAGALPLARRNHCQRHGHGGSGDDEYAFRDGLPGLAAHLSAGEAASESSVFRHGEPDRRKRGCSGVGAG